MASTLKRPALGVLVAVAITTTMDAVGLSAFSALPLCALMLLFWYEHPPRARLGFTLGRWSHYGLAVLHPVVVIGTIAITAAAAGGIEAQDIDWRRAGINLAVQSLATMLIAMVTEEGFFRGWLWGSLERTGMPQTRVLLWTSAAFSIWHLSSVTFDTGFDPPVSQVPLYMLNAFMMGTIWGLLRWISGSIVVASVSHAIWNALAYVLFGFGTSVGALGIEDTALYGPEVGLMGLVLNALFASVLWHWWTGRLLPRGDTDLRTRMRRAE